MQYAHTLTDQKLDSISSIESPARYTLKSMQYIPTLTEQKFDSLLKQPTRKDPFFVYPCRGVLHTPNKCSWQWANDSSTRYVSIKYVLIESYIRQKFDSPSPIESFAWYISGRMQYAPTLTDQKFDSQLKPPTRSDPFFMYRRRGVLHTPHKCPWQWANESSARYVYIKYVLIESYTR